MKKSIYRNFYYVKESIADFFQCNKKHLFFSLLLSIIGIAIAICIGINNFSCYSFININDKILIAFLSTKSWLTLFLRYTFKYLFFCVLIIVLCNFNFLSYFNYILFAYLSFNVVLNGMIIASIFSITGILYVILCYIPLLLLCNFLLITIYLMCKCSANSCGCSSKISSFPIKAILICFALIVLVLVIFSLITLIVSKFFINII